MINIDNLEGFLTSNNTWFFRSETGALTTDIIVSFGEEYATHRFKFVTSDLNIKSFTSEDAKTLFQNNNAEVV